MHYALTTDLKLTTTLYCSIYIFEWSHTRLSSTDLRDYSILDITNG